MELKIDKSNVIKAHMKADNKGKELLENVFGKDVFTQKITDRVKTFEDACSIIKPSESASILLKYNGIDMDMIGAKAMLKLTIIVKALNEGWEPDWSNSKEYKYYPYFEKSSSGLGFSYLNSAFSFKFTYVGSRLCFKTEELACYAGKQFIDIYNDFLSNE